MPSITSSMLFRGFLEEILYWRGCSPVSRQNFFLQGCHGTRNRGIRLKQLAFMKMVVFLASLAAKHQIGIINSIKHPVLSFHLCNKGGIGRHFACIDDANEKVIVFQQSVSARTCNYEVVFWPITINFINQAELIY